MIVTSHPYNPSQQSQQQRCIGLNQDLSKQQQQQLQSSSSSSSCSSNNLMSRNNNSNSNNNMFGLSGSQQQNSLYGSAAFVGNQQQSQHMLDLANLQQSVFDSNYDIATNNINNNNNMTTTTEQIEQATSNRGVNNNNNNKQRLLDSNQQADMSLYSPSSSTSLLYHIYDQINLPNEQQPYQQQQQNSTTNQNNHNNNPTIGIKKNNTTTILNPANLFSNQNNLNIQNQLPLQMQMHQHQLSNVGNDLQKTLALQHLQQQQQQQQQQCYSTAGHYTHLQQHPFSTLSHHHNQSIYLNAQQQQQNLMLDTVMRQHQLQQQNATTSRRPLSSSGASSTTMSGQTTITYGRQPRVNATTTTASTTNGTGTLSSKSHNNLASVLHSSNTLNHLALITGSNGIIGLGGGSNSSSIKGGYYQSRINNNNNNNNYSFGSRAFKRVNQSARHYLYEHGTIIKCSLLLILLAFSLMTIIKFILLPTSSSASTTTTTTNQSPYHNQQPSHLDSNSLYTPPYQKTQIIPPQPGSMSTTLDDIELTLPVDKQSNKPPQRDTLKSKLIIGEFVILSQNYSHLESQKLLLAERIVKLMDQVILASDLRQVYSRMEVTSIRPNQPSGIIVNCNIILNESIDFAAPLFGTALYESLSKNQDRLANQANYVIDKTSIRFNTVPDNDLRQGIVPADLIPPSVSKEILGVSTSAGSSSISSSSGSGQSGEQQQFGSGAPSIELPSIAPTSVLGGNTQQSSPGHHMESVANQVVWSAWSSWSTCIDKNGNCDPLRIHSRLRNCIHQFTGEKVDLKLCQERFDLNDVELESEVCVCKQQQGDNNLHHIMSDAPSVIAPLTAPSVMVDGGTFMTPNGKSVHGANKILGQSMPVPGASVVSPTKESTGAELYTPTSISMVSSSSASSSRVVGNNEQLYMATSTEKSQSISDMASAAAVGGPSSSANNAASNPSSTPSNQQQQQQVVLPMIQLEQQQQQQPQLSCTNCTSDEICLLLISQKVPFCAKTKDRSDESGCGGWCKSQNQICQPIGQNAFKCTHDSECLAEEWRCHDSTCIPLSKRCDGHFNCYDNSDERDCPI